MLKIIYWYVEFKLWKELGAVKVKYIVYIT